jgi:hypothetical protein
MFEFEAEVIEWRGPAPFYFAKTPPDIASEIEASSAQLSYGWGCIPVDVTIGGTTYYTALIPREGSYVVPLKAAIRKAEKIELSDLISVRLKPKG